jgi:hypothetical protein
MVENGKRLQPVGSLYCFESTLGEDRRDLCTDRLRIVDS